MEGLGHLGADSFFDLYLGQGIYVHWLRNAHCKTIRIDLTLSHLLRRPNNAYGALVSRISERGTAGLSTMQEVCRAVDDLYGSFLSTDVSTMGNQHLLHVSLEVLAARFVDEKDRPELLARALELVRQIAMEPYREGDAYSTRYVEQEKRSLREQIASLYNDKMIYAQWRCAQEVDGIEHTSLGQERDVQGINARGLWSFHRDLLRESQVHFYLSGNICAEDIISVGNLVPTWFQAYGRNQVEEKALTNQPTSPSPCVLRRIFERGQVVQSKLVYGFGVPIPQDLRAYVALLLFNALWGGGTTSFLYRYLREEMRLCYFIDSQIDPLRGRGYVLAGIEREAYSRTLDEIHRALSDFEQGRVSTDDWNRTRAILSHRIAALKEDRDALQRLNMRSMIAGFAMVPSEMEYHLTSLQLGEVLSWPGRLTARVIYFLYGDGTRDMGT